VLFVLISERHPIRRRLRHERRVSADYSMKHIWSETAPLQRIRHSALSDAYITHFGGTINSSGRIKNVKSVDAAPAKAKTFVVYALPLPDPEDCTGVLVHVKRIIRGSDDHAHHTTYPCRRHALSNSNPTPQQAHGPLPIVPILVKSSFVNQPSGRPSPVCSFIQPSSLPLPSS